MEYAQRITDTYQSSTPPTVAPVASCLERLELLATASTDKALTRESLVVLIKLVAYVNSELGIAWPTQERLGQDLGMSQPNVSRALKQLEALGYMVRSREAPRLDDAPCTVYRLTVPAPTPDTNDISPEICESPASHITTDMRDISPPICEDISPPIYKPGSVNPVLNPVPRKHPSDASGGVAAARRERPPQRPPEPQFGYLPADWKPSEQAVTEAMVKYQLSREQVLDQTERFRVNHRSKLTRSGDWPALWGLWVSEVRPGGPYRWRVESRGTYASHTVGVLSNMVPPETMLQPRGGYK